MNTFEILVIVALIVQTVIITVKENSNYKNIKHAVDILNRIAHSNKKEIENLKTKLK